MNSLSSMVFYSSNDVPNIITSKMIHYERDLPLSSSERWKEPFIMKGTPEEDPISVERVKAALAKGPFIAEAKLGPIFYRGAPKEFKNQISTHPELSVHGWNSEQRNPEMTQKPYQEIIVCGVSTAHVYYLLAKEKSTDWPSGITEHQKTSNKVYVASVQRFSQALYNMHPPTEQKKTAEAFISRSDRLVKEREKVSDLLETILGREDALKQESDSKRESKDL